ncbi:hypothetical protein ACFVHB_36780 [Kitasatospora sp. NPDC127111]|uniref:hypothetical protein n=1 Tax=Kitasatospora sp. NPDC127111 TaxID=3345363 RepID=UPI00363E2C6F
MSRISDNDSMPTPDRLLHTGAEHPVDPEDLVMASGRDVTPALVEKARQDLAKYGARAVERLLP